MPNQFHPSRRKFLAASGALLSRPLSAKPCGGFIDAHVHIWTPDTSTYPLAAGFAKGRMAPPSFTPEELFTHCRPEGVARIVLVQMSFYKYDNRYMLDMMAAHPGVFGGIAIVDENLQDVKGTMKALAAKGVRGFRIRSTKASAESWPSSPGMVVMWKSGADNGLSMCLLADPDSLPSALAMAKKYPRTPVVIDHFARIGMHGSVDQKELDNLLRFADLPNVRVKTSAFYALGNKAAPFNDLAPMVRQLRDAFGANRLMWASDCPYQVVGGHNYADSISLIRDKLDFLSEEDKSWMLRKTAEKVFF
jgi:predicted TIM-barrel fold metal-dependent hydrolase